MRAAVLRGGKHFFRCATQIDIGQPVLFGEINFGAGLVGVEGRSCGPLVGAEEELPGGANDGEQEAGLMEVDEAVSGGLGELVERGLHGLHVFEWRKMEGE